MMPAESDAGAPCRILAISSSLHELSRSASALRVACEAVVKAGALVDLLDLQREPPMFFRGGENVDSAETALLRARFRQADGYLLAGPQYHNAPNGALISTLNFVSYPDCETTGKPFGLIATAGGRHGAWPTLGALRLMCRSLGGWVLPQQVTASHEEFDSSGELTDDVVVNRLRHLGHSMAFHARLFRDAEATMPDSARVGHHNQREPI